MAWKARLLLKWTILSQANGLRFDDSSSSADSLSADTLSPAVMSPAWCPDECSECDELGNCLACDNEYVLQSFECVESCMDGFFKSEFECVECPIECSHCTSETVREQHEV